MWDLTATMLLKIFRAGATRPASQATDSGNLPPISVVKYNWGNPGDANHVRIQYAQTKTGCNASIHSVATPVEDTHGGKRR
jgi:hypothetical protein